MKWLLVKLGHGLAAEWRKKGGRTHYNKVHNTLQELPVRQYKGGDVVALAGHFESDEWIAQVLDFFSTDEGTYSMMMFLRWLYTRNQVLEPTHLDEWEEMLSGNRILAYEVIE